MSGESEAYFRRLREDHALSLAALFGAAIYAWQVHGLGFGIGVLFAVWLLVAITNLIVGNISSVHTISRNLRRGRWTVLIAAWLLLLLTAIETCDTTGHCTRLLASSGGVAGHPPAGYGRQNS